MSDSLEAKVKVLEKQVQVLQDIEDIKKLETAYGYFLEHLMFDEIAECWADNGAMEWLGLGVFKGKEVIRNQWKSTKEHFLQRGEFMHFGPRFCGYITINPDGKTASGRWYVAGGQMGASMLCEDTYVKENGVWKINMLSVGGFPMMGGAPVATSAQGPDAAGASAGGQGPDRLRRNKRNAMLSNT